jgi:serine/threonine protein kinase
MRGNAEYATLGAGFRRAFTGESWLPDIRVRTTEKTMEKLRTVLGRFTSGQSNVDELRSVFRDYLREYPEQREAVARWLADSIRIGRMSPALMLTIEDLLAAGSPATYSDATVHRPARKAQQPDCAGPSDLDQTVYPEPVALETPEVDPGVPARPPPRPSTQPPGRPITRPPTRPPTRQSPFPSVAQLPMSQLRSIDGPASTGLSVVELSNIKATADAMAVDADGAAQVGDVLADRYTLVAELGRGGMGSVFKALDRNREDFHARNPYIALKLLSDDFRRHPDAVMALQRETERAQSLAHENIVKVFDFDYDGPHAYMTMELLEGESLESWLRGPEFERASPERKWNMVEQIGGALVCAHKNGVVHSDLKPGNMFICSSGTVKVMDFGIARPLREVGTEKDTTLFDPGKRLGGLTPAYASLEQWNQERPDARDDVYSFACVVYYLYAGRHPRGSINSKEELENSPPPRRIRSLTRLQWDTLRRGLALRRQDRIASVQEFLAGFAPRTWFRRYRASIATVAATAACLLLYFGFRYYQDFAADQTLNSQLWPSTDTPAQPLTAEQRRDIDDYLYLGKATLQQAGNTRSSDELIALLSRGDNNLLDMLKRVRGLDPANAQAQKLTQDAASLFEDRARALLNANRPADSLRLVVEGQSFAHTYELFRLKRSICRTNTELCRG